MKFIRIAGRLVNAAAIESIRLDDENAVVWLVGKADPLHASKAEVVAIHEYVREAMV